jgi:hypothetical protein
MAIAHIEPQPTDKSPPGSDEPMRMYPISGGTFRFGATREMLSTHCDPPSPPRIVATEPPDGRSAQQEPSKRDATLFRCWPVVQLWQDERGNILRLPSRNSLRLGAWRT